MQQHLHHWQLSPGPCRGDTHSQGGGQGAGALAGCGVPGVTTHPQGSETGLPVPGGGLLGRAEWGAHGVPRPHLHLQNPLPGGGEHPGEVRLQGRAPFPGCWVSWVALSRWWGMWLQSGGSDGCLEGEQCWGSHTWCCSNTDPAVGEEGGCVPSWGTALGGLTHSPAPPATSGDGGSCRHGLLAVQG